MDLFSFENQHVRDLAWALGSPPLMQPAGSRCRWFDAAWYQQVLEESGSWLQQLDRQPQALGKLIEAERDQRLGRYFELLWLYWFEHSERYDVLGSNIQIVVDGTTLGELDLIVHDRSSGKNIHIEMAIKFYLGLGDTRLASNWYGPNKKDRLDIKMSALIERQTRLSNNDHVRQMLNDRGIRVDECAVIIKGRLFYPGKGNDYRLVPAGCCPQHLRSFWLSQSDLDDLEELQYTPLSRRGWLAGTAAEGSETLYSKGDIRRAIALGEQVLPLYLTGHRKAEENLRLFVVPDGWSTTL